MKKYLSVAIVLFAASFYLSSMLFCYPGIDTLAFASSLPSVKYIPKSLISSNDTKFVLFNQTLSSVSFTEKEVPSSAAHVSFFPESTTANGESNPVPENIYETEITKGGTSLFGVEINNETDYDLKNALKELPNPENPTVLIVHTHTSESYRPSKLYPYTPKDNSRTEDPNYNVSRVGEELTEKLLSYGINVIHDSAINDYPSYNGSYQKTLNLIESHLDKNPSIDIIIDLHRDAMERDDGTKISTVCMAKNEKAAQVMLVVGTDQGGLTHPDWKSNFSFAVKLQSIINKHFPRMARPINVRKERFNGHVSPKEIIIEVGTTGNTLEEALASANALAFAINEYYKG